MVSVSQLKRYIAKTNVCLSWSWCRDFGLVNQVLVVAFSYRYIFIEKYWERIDSGKRSQAFAIHCVQVRKFQNGYPFYEFTFWKTWSLFLCCWLFFGNYKIFVFPFLAKLSIRSEFLQFLFNNLSQCHENNHNMKSLSRIREPVWLHLTENCSSFQARDCNACLSQIFEEKTFGNLNSEEASLFATQRAFDSYCQTCEKDVTFNSRIFSLTWHILG